MGKVNDALCEYFGTAEYFADFWNGTEFWKRQKLDNRQLERCDKEYYKNGKPKRGSLYRDLLWYCKGKWDMFLGMEIMDSIDYTMPLRIMDYNTQELKRQLKDIKTRNQEAAKHEKKWKHKGEFLYKVCKEDRVIPVHTVALYCGKEEYDGVHDVLEMMDIENVPEEDRELLNNYPVRIYSVRHLDENCFETSLRELIAIVKRSESSEAMREYYLENEERFHALDEISIDAMGALIGKSNLKEFKREKGGIDMCKAFEDVKAEGRAEARRQAVEKMMEKLKLTAEQVMEILDVPLEERTSWVRKCSDN